MPRGGTWGKPYPTFGNTAFANTVVAPADIAALIASWGVTPLGAYVAQYGLTSTDWPDARGRGIGPTATFAVGGAPTISGSGATALASFTASQSCIATYTGALPASDYSILYVGGMNNGNAFGPYIADGTTTWGITSTSGEWSSGQFISTTKTLSSTQTCGATVNAVAVSGTWAGATTVEVDAQSQVTGASTFTAHTPSGNLTLGISGKQSAQPVQAVFFLPVSYTSAMFTAFIAWAVANRTFTAQ